MPKVLVSILSDHIIPNYLFIKEMAGLYDELLFVSTEYVESKGIGVHLEKTLKLEAGSVSRVLVDNDNYQKIFESLCNLIHSSENEYIVNLTGGTKAMSIAVFDYFRKFDSHFVYIPIGTNTYYDLASKESHNLKYRVELNEYFSLYGLHFQKEENFICDKSTTLAFFNKLKKRNFYLSNEIYNSKSQDSPELRRYYSGAWFEEYTYYRIKDDYSLPDGAIAMSLKIFREDSATNDNEIDVAFVFQNVLYTVECKVSMYGYGKEPQKVIEDYMYKIAAVSKDFGLHVNSYLFTLHKMNKLSEQSLANVYKRMRILGIRDLIDGDKLSENKIKL